MGEGAVLPGRPSRDRRGRARGANAISRRGCSHAAHGDPQRAAGTGRPASPGMSWLSLSGCEAGVKAQVLDESRYPGSITPSLLLMPTASGRFLQSPADRLGGRVIAAAVANAWPLVRDAPRHLSEPT